MTYHLWVAVGIVAAFTAARLQRDDRPELAPWRGSLALAAVALILFLGLVNMMRGGSGNRSQQLMRLRVLLQFAAIVIMMTALYLTAR